MHIAFLAIRYCILNILQYSVNVNFIYICVTHFLERFTLLQWSVTYLWGLPVYLFVCCRKLNSWRVRTSFTHPGSCSQRLFHNFAVSDWMTLYGQPLIIVQFYVFPKVVWFYFYVLIFQIRKKKSYSSQTFMGLCVWPRTKSSLSSEDYL